MEFLKPNTNNRDILNEVYFGETKDIKELLDLIHEFREKYIHKRNRAYVFPGSNSDPSLMKISEKLEDMFGFGAVDLNIINETYMNAITYPIIYNIGCKPEDHIHSTPNGFKFDKEFNYVTQINYTSNVFLNEEFTDREILAVLLHEVGHSFVLVQKEMVPLVTANRDSIVINCILLAIINLFSLNIGGAIQNLKVLFNSFNVVKAFKTNINKNIKNSAIGRIYDKVNTSIFERLKIFSSEKAHMLFKISGLENVTKALTLILNGWIFANNKQKDQISKSVKDANSFDRSMEYFADNFPASYGLGTDLASALQKMEFRKATASEKSINKIAKLNPLNSILGEMVKLPYYEMLNNIDVHPKYANRVNKIEADLKRELSKSKMNPKMKKEIEKSLKEISTLKENFKKCEKIKDSDPNTYKQIWMAAFIDEKESDFLTSAEKSYTSMKDRDEFFDTMMKEHAELFENEADIYEFV